MLLAIAFDFAAWTPLAAFVMLIAVAWAVIELLSNKSQRAEERLEELRDPTVRRKREEEGGGRKGPRALAKLWEKATPALSKPLTPKKESEVVKLRDRLSYAGFRSDLAPQAFLTIKLIAMILGLSSGGGLLYLHGNIGFNTLLKAGMLGGVFFYAPDVLLWWMGKKRKENIFLSLPDALDLMVVCVEAGLGLDQAMKKVSDEMKKTYRIISHEFGLCNLQMQVGRPRSEVLHDLGRRNGVEDLRSLASIIIQADKFGSSIAQALRVQSDSMRTRRRQIAEEKAAKTAVKLIFPLVIFIFPGIFVVLVGPAAITMVREMFPVMSAHQ